MRPLPTILAIWLLFLAACPTGSDPQPVPDPPGASDRGDSTKEEHDAHESPQSIFAYAQEALRRNDSKAIFESYNPITRDRALYMSVAFLCPAPWVEGAAREPFDSLARKHRLDLAPIYANDPREPQNATPEKLDAAARALFSPVEDKMLLFQALMAFDRRQSDRMRFEIESDARLLDGKVTNLEIDGDRAEGHLELEGTGAQQILFYRVEEKWYLGTRSVWPLVAGA